MKLRIRGNSIRFRLTQGEVKTFEEVGSVESQVDFPTPFRYVLTTSASVENPETTFENGTLTVIVPEKLAHEWTRTERVGFEDSFNSIKILIEKDFACLKPRDDEDESDNYPHPQYSAEKHLGC